MQTVERVSRWKCMQPTALQHEIARARGVLAS
jgi:hypothetical protein